MNERTVEVAGVEEAMENREGLGGAKEDLEAPCLPLKILGSSVNRADELKVGAVAF